MGNMASTRRMARPKRIPKRSNFEDCFEYDVPGLRAFRFKGQRVNDGKSLRRSYATSISKVVKQKAASALQISKVQSESPKELQSLSASVGKQPKVLKPNVSSVQQESIPTENKVSKLPLPRPVSDSEYWQPVVVLKKANDSSPSKKLLTNNDREETSKHFHDDKNREGISVPIKKRKKSPTKHTFVESKEVKKPGILDNWFDDFTTNDNEEDSGVSVIETSDHFMPYKSLSDLDEVSGTHPMDYVNDIGNVMAHSVDNQIDTNEINDNQSWSALQFIHLLRQMQKMKDIIHILVCEVEKLKDLSCSKDSEIAFLRQQLEQYEHFQFQCIEQNI